VIVMKPALLIAVQVQPMGAATETAPPPPPEDNDWPDGEIVKLHPTTTPAWTTVKVCPAIVMVPDRVLATLLADTE